MPRLDIVKAKNDTLNSLDQIQNKLRNIELPSFQSNKTPFIDDTCLSIKQPKALEKERSKSEKKSLLDNRKYINIYKQTLSKEKSDDVCKKDDNLVSVKKMIEQEKSRIKMIGKSKSDNKKVPIIEIDKMKRIRSISSRNTSRERNQSPDLSNKMGNYCENELTLSASVFNVDDDLDT